jgi:hypothetical protein
VWEPGRILAWQQQALETALPGVLVRGQKMKAVQPIHLSVAGELWQLLMLKAQLKAQQRQP